MKAAKYMQTETTVNLFVSSNFIKANILSKKFVTLENSLINFLHKFRLHFVVISVELSETKQKRLTALVRAK